MYAFAVRAAYHRREEDAELGILSARLRLVRELRTSYAWALVRILYGGPMARFGFLTLGLLLGAKTAALGQERPSNPVVGCYLLELGSWNPALSSGNAPYQTPPELIRLSMEVGEGVFERGRWLARPLIPHGRTPSGYWERLGPDSVAVTWTNGFAGVRLHLGFDEESLQGIAQAFTDVSDGSVPPQADVSARPTACPGDHSS
jgi:hypothetical protein